MPRRDSGAQMFQGSHGQLIDCLYPVSYFKLKEGKLRRKDVGKFHRNLLSTRVIKKRQTAVNRWGINNQPMTTKMNKIYDWVNAVLQRPSVTDNPHIHIRSWNRSMADIATFGHVVYVSYFILKCCLLFLFSLSLVPPLCQSPMCRCLPCPWLFCLFAMCQVCFVFLFQDFWFFPCSAKWMSVIFV